MVLQISQARYSTSNANRWQYNVVAGAVLQKNIVWFLLLLAWILPTLTMTGQWQLYLTMMVQISVTLKIDC
jgi:hypothetical protein